MDFKKLYELYVETYHSAFIPTLRVPEATTHHERIASSYALHHFKAGQQLWDFEVFSKYVK